MKKILIILFFPIALNAQVSDTLSGANEQLLRLVGGFIKTEMQKQLKEDGIGNGVKGLVGSTIKDVLKNTATKSAGELLNLGGNFGNGILLPNIITQNKDALIKKGKGVLIENFQSSLKNAANDALVKSIPMMVAQAVEFNLDSMIKYANADSVSITSIFKNANKNALLKIVKPVAKAAFKVSGSKKQIKKLSKALKSVTDENFALSPENILSEKIVDSFLGEMKNQENMLKKNPATLLDGLMKLFKD